MDRILHMVRKGAYTRKPKGAEPARRTPQHFLRQWRERETEEFPNGMSQEELSERSGCSVSAISSYERGASDPSLEAWGKLSAGLGGIPRGMLIDVNPGEEPDLWSAYLRADENQRDSIGKMAAGIVAARPGHKRPK